MKDHLEIKRFSISFGLLLIAARTPIDELKREIFQRNNEQKILKPLYHGRQTHDYH